MSSNTLNMENCNICDKEIGSTQGYSLCSEHDKLRFKGFIFFKPFLIFFVFPALVVLLGIKDKIKTMVAG